MTTQFDKARENVKYTPKVPEPSCSPSLYMPATLTTGASSEICFVLGVAFGLHTTVESEALG
jgi:hypothetical protein